MSSVNTHQITRPTIIYIEGNIGCGKSTLLSKLAATYQRSTQITVIPENVDKWNNTKVNGVGILELFYQDMDKWRGLFECTILKDRFDILREYAVNMKDNQLLIIERSAESSKEVFVRDGGCTQDEWVAYCDLYNTLKQTTTLPEDVVIEYLYIRTDAHECQSRINRRNRSGEEGIPLNYLQQIEAKGDEFARAFDSRVINGQQSPADVFDYTVRVINDIISRV